MVAWDPVLDRLFALHVPPGDVSTMERVGNTFGNRSQRVLDMVKFIEWAKRNVPRKPSDPLTPSELELARRLLGTQFRAKSQLQSHMDD